jgi:hypothetical protein
MQRERKHEQQRERFYARELKKRAKRHKEFAAVAYHHGANAAADDGEQIEGMKTTAAAAEIHERANTFESTERNERAVESESTDTFERAVT